MDAITSPGLGAALPRRFGDRYTLERELARGGMGRVYVGTDHKLERKVAIKILGASAHDEEGLRRFQQEARTTGSLQHPNILAVFDAGEDEGKPFIVMELLEGKSLRRLLDGGALPLQQALDLGVQLLRGLAVAHDKGIVHRDLKPDNLFLTNDGFLKILDFGIVKLLPPPSDEEGEQFATPQGGIARAPRTQTGAIVGTVGYMPPEQVRGQPVDHRADLFSFGAVLYELISGKRAFTGGSSVEIAYTILTREPEGLPGAVPVGVRRLVQHCLKKQRDERPASARELLAWLEPMVSKTHRSLPLLTGHAVALFERRKKWILGLLSAAVVAALLPLAVAQFMAPLKLARRASVRVVAVLPFTVRGDQQYGYLGEGMVDLLSTNLTSAGAIRAVDPAALIPAALREGNPLDEKQAATLARRFNASLYVLGSVLEVEKSLRVRATLYDADRGLLPVAQAHAEGHASQLFHLVDQVTAQLRSSLGDDAAPLQGPGGRLGRIAQLTTRSPEALKHYLEGEATLRRFSFKGAREALQRAVTVDPDFALAHYRLAVAAGVIQPGLASDSLRRAVAMSDRLSVRDRALLEAYAALHAGRTDEAERLYRRITRDYPDEVEAWYQLGELYFHMNPARGRSLAEAEEPMAKVLVLDPQHGAALAHLVDVAQFKGNRPVVAALADRYLGAATPEPGSTVPRRFTKAWAQGDEAGKAAILEELRRPGALREDVAFTLERAIWQGDDLQDARTLAKVLTGLGTPQQRAEGFRAQAVLEVARGRRRAAKALLLAAVELAPERRHRHDVLWVDTLTFLPISREEAEADLAQVDGLDVPKSPVLPTLKLFLEGALSIRAGDVPRALRAAAALEQAEAIGEGSAPIDLAHSIRARAALQAGRRGDALAELTSAPMRVPYNFSASVHHFAEHQLRADLLLGEGRTGEAVRWSSAFAFYGVWEAAWIAPGQLILARAYEAEGRRAEAIGAYRRFLSLRKECDPELEPEAENARARLQALEATEAQTAH